MQILGEGLHKVWVTSGQTKNSPGPPTPELQSQPILPASAAVTLQWSQPHRLGGPPYPSIPWAREQPHVLILGWLRQGGEKKIELINTPWLPPSPSWGKATIYEPIVLTQGKASQQCSSVPHCTGFFLPDYRVATQEATWHLMAGGKILKLEAKRPKFWFPLCHSQAPNS